MFGAASLTRRMWLKTTSCGFGYLALASLCSQESTAAPYQNPLAPRAPHFPARAKRVIFLCMNGGPTHVDTFDYKPALARDHGMTVAGPGGRRPTLLKSPWKFHSSGRSRLPISELFPHLSRHADKLCLLNSMHTDTPSHSDAFLKLHTGASRFPRPSIGAWTTYGLGSENQDLPGFITISPAADNGGAQNYGNAFLPAAYRATRIGEERGSIAQARIGNLTSPLSPSLQRGQLDLLQEMNQNLLAGQQVSPEIEGVINSYELGFRMQTALPALMDQAREPQSVRDMYGIGTGRSTDNFGRQCLMARCFAEAGVRFIELGHGGWDTHANLVATVPGLCRQIDQPIAALLTDLAQRGLLEDTLVMWGGEFGRTAFGQGPDGRDHANAGYSMWLAGGGVKGGIRHGATDEHGIVAVEKPLHQHDLHATVLHLLGLDHQRLSYHYGGRDYMLTDIHGNVAHDIMA